MASLEKRSNHWRATVRRHGVRRSATFTTKSAAESWAAAEESAIVRAAEQKKEFGRRGRNGLLSPEEICALSIPNIGGPGIYFLISGGEIVYIGKSKNVSGRLRDHIKNGRGFDRFTVHHCTEEELDGLEKKYISAFNPAQNKT